MAKDDKEDMQLPQVGSLSEFVRRIEHYRQTAPATGKPLLKYVKNGIWLLGTKNEECNGALAAINPFTIKIGYVQWLDGRVVEESKPMIPFTMGWLAVPRDRFPPDADLTQKWLVDVKLLNTPPIDAVYSCATDGGAKAIDEIITAVHRRAIEGRAPYLVPVVKLGSDSYKHTMYGVTFKPIFEIQHWLDVEGKPEVAPRRALV